MHWARSSPARTASTHFTNKLSAKAQRQQARHVRAILDARPSPYAFVCRGSPTQTHMSAMSHLDANLLRLSAQRMLATSSIMNYHMPLRCSERAITVTFKYLLDLRSSTDATLIETNTSFGGCSALTTSKPSSDTGNMPDKEDLLQVTSVEVSHSKSIARPALRILMLMVHARIQQCS